MENATTTSVVRSCLKSLLLFFPLGASAQQSSIHYAMVGAPQILPLKSSIPYDDAPACELHRINAMMFQSDGTLIVSNGGNFQLCVFSPNGKFVRTIGRNGSGPGEFGDIFLDIDRLPGDSITVADKSARRLSIFAPNGTFAHSFSLNPPDDALGPLTFARGLKNGSLLLAYSTVRTAVPQPTAMNFQSRFFVVNSKGTEPKSLGTINTTEHFVQRADPSHGGTAYWSLAFGKSTSVARFSDGYLVSEGGTSEIDEMTKDGKVRATHEFTMPLRPVTEKHRSDWRRDVLKPSAHPTGMNSAMEEKNLAAEMPFPKNFPSLGELMTDESKMIWAERYPLPGEMGATWFRLDPATKRIATFTFPSRFKPMAVHSNKVCGIGFDADDVQGVRCWVVQ